MTDWRTLDTPCVLADMAIVRRNLRRAQESCDSLGLRFRPHIKTHKIPEFARMQIAAGACGITCQKLGEAEVMAAAGVRDILITYNILGSQKIERLRRLARDMQKNGGSLAACADSKAVARALAHNDEAPLPVMAECDTGGGRCGVQSPQAAAELAAFINSQTGLRFSGLMTYPAAGGVWQADNFLAEAKAQCEARGLQCDIISSGGTPDFAAIDGYTVVNEIRAGTYLYNDRSLIARGACMADDCALTVLTTVVSVPVPGRAIIDAGSKILTSDVLNLKDYGELLGAPRIRCVSLSEEHGQLEMPPGALQVGDAVRIIPNHACVVSNMTDAVIAIDGDKILQTYTVAARGCVR